VGRRECRLQKEGGCVQRSRLMAPGAFKGQAKTVFSLG